MSKVSDLLGVVGDLLQIGIGQSGAKTLRFRNSAGNLDLVGNATADASISLPDRSGRLLLEADDYYQPLAVCKSHFLGGLGEWASTVTGSGSAVATGSVADPGGRPGIARGVSGSTTTGRTGIISAASGIRVGNGNLYFRTDFRLPTLSNGTDRYTIRAGLINNIGEPVHGIYFRYADNVNSGNWQVVGRRNDIETVINTSTAPAANTWVSLRIEYINATSTAEYFINDVSQGTINTNLPTNTSGEQQRGAVYLTKSVGTSSSVIEIDYAFLGANIA
jgi:hypothetical protein